MNSGMFRLVKTYSVVPKDAAFISADTAEISPGRSDRQTDGQIVFQLYIVD